MIVMYSDKMRTFGILKDDIFAGPRKITFNITNKCNQKCIFCWFHSNMINYREKPTEFDFDVFKKTIDEACSMGLKSVGITGEGEPTSYYRISDLINYAKAKKVRVSLNSNGAFEGKLLKHIINIESLIVNLPTSKFSTYKKMQEKNPEKNFKATIKNLKRLQRLKISRIGPNLTLVFIVNKFNWTEIPEFLDFAESLRPDMIDFRLMEPTKETKPIVLSPEQIGRLRISLKKICGYKLPFKTNLPQFYESLNPITPDEEYYDGYHRLFYFMPKAFRSPFRCYIGWFYSLIDIDGNVAPCCENQQLLMGNVHKQSFKEIWLSDKFKKFRIGAKYNFDINKREWKCHYCPFIDFNKKMEIKVRKIEAAIKNKSS